MATIPPVVQEFRADTRHYTRTLDAMARHLGALVAELEQIEREEAGPPPERPAETVRRVGSTLAGLADELAAVSGERDCSC